MPNDDINAMLQEAGAGDLAGELDGLPPLPKAKTPQRGGAPLPAAGEDDQAEIEGDDEGGELDELELLGGDEDEDGPDIDGDDEPAPARGRAGSRIAMLSRENRRLYSVLDRLLQGGGASPAPEREDETPAFNFEFDTTGLKPPAGVDEADFRDEVGATAPIISAAFNQFAKQFLIPLAKQQGLLANIVGDLHLEKSLPGWSDPKIKPVRDKLFAQLPPQLRASLNNEAGAALLTLAAQGAVKAKAARKEERDLDRRRGRVEGAGGVEEREAPNSNSRLKRLQTFTRTASDEEFLAGLDSMEGASHRAPRR